MSGRGRRRWVWVSPACRNTADRLRLPQLSLQREGLRQEREEVDREAQRKAQQLQAGYEQRLDLERYVHCRIDLNTDLYTECTHIIIELHTEHTHILTCTSLVMGCVTVLSHGAPSISHTCRLRVGELQAQVTRLNKQVLAQARCLLVRCIVVSSVIRSTCRV